MLNYEILMLDKPDIVPEDYYEVNYSMDSVDNIILPEQWEFDNPDEILKPGLNTNIKVLYKDKKTLSFLRPQNSKVKEITIPNSVKYKKTIIRLLLFQIVPVKV